MAGGISASKFSLGIWLIPGNLAWLELLPSLVSSAQLCPNAVQICDIFWLPGVSQVLFWDSNKVQISVMWQCWWCSTSHGLSKPAGWPEVAISCLKQNSGGWCPENEWNQAEKLKYSLQVIQKRMGKRIKHPDSVLCCQGWAVSWHTVLQVCNIVIRSLNHTQLDKCH